MSPISSFDIHPSWLMVSGLALAILPLVVPVIAGWAKVTIILGFIRNGIGFQHTGAALIDGSLGLLIALLISAPIYSQMFRDLEVAFKEVNLSRPINQQKVEQLTQLLGPLKRFLQINSGITEIDIAHRLTKHRGSNNSADNRPRGGKLLAGAVVTELSGETSLRSMSAGKACFKNSGDFQSTGRNLVFGRNPLAGKSPRCESSSESSSELGSNLISELGRGPSGSLDRYVSGNLCQKGASSDRLMGELDTNSQAPVLSIILAFFLTEVREGLLLGLKILVPFLIVDFVVANLLAGMGMFLLSPQVITLPLKVLLFLTAGGYNLLTEGAVLSYLYPSEV